MVTLFKLFMLMHCLHVHDDSVTQMLMKNELHRSD